MTHRLGKGPLAVIWRRSEARQVTSAGKGCRSCLELASLGSLTRIELTSCKGAQGLQVVPRVQYGLRAKEMHRCDS